MAKPALTLRSVKGSALTFTEMDTNLGNLANAVVQISAGSTTSNIDLNSGFTVANTATVTASLVGTTLSLNSTINLSSPAVIGNVSPNAGTFTTLTNTVRANLKNVNEGTVYDLGTTGGTVAPDVANGNVQKITLNSALTINGFTNPVAGQTLTLIIYGGVGYSSITSTMKFANADRALTNLGGAIDFLSIFYDGTTYFASLNRGFA